MKSKRVMAIGLAAALGIGGFGLTAVAEGAQAQGVIPTPSVNRFHDYGIVTGAHNYSPGAAFVEIGDVVGDPRGEIIVADSMAGLHMLEYYGNGNFKETLIAPPSGLSRPTSLQLRDVDNDGRLDIILGESNRVHTFRNMGDGVFREWGYPYGRIQYRYGDFDRDGDLDVCIIDQWGREYCDDDGEWPDGHPYYGMSWPLGWLFWTQPQTGWYWTWEDRDGDGDLDLVLKFRIQIGTPRYASPRPPLMVTIDADNDDDLDLFFGTGWPPGVYFKENIGSGMNNPVFIGGNSTIPLEAIAAGDVSGDGMADVVYVDQYARVGFIERL